MSREPIKVLLVERDPDDAQRLVDAAASRQSTPIDLAHATTLDDALERLAAERFDVVLVDLELPDAAGADAVARVHEQAPEVAVIALTREEDDAMGVQALKGGAQDSLVKGTVDGGLLVRSIRYAIERQQMRMTLEAMALVDDLTGLYNRRGFLTLARQQLKVADRMGRELSQLFIDVDHLKAINDSFGHAEGDLLLLEVAELLRETFRDSDIIARIGGDEFVVLAMETAGAAPGVLSERLDEAVARRNAQPGRRVPLSLSVGVAHYDPELPCPIEELLARADELMYRQKRARRSASPAGALSVLLPRAEGAAVEDGRDAGE